jgi:hypothetical protein
MKPERPTPRITVVRPAGTWEDRMRTEIPTSDRAHAAVRLAATLLSVAIAVPTAGAATPEAAAPPAPAPAASIEVMIVGTYHLGNPGLDLNNVAAEDVTTPKRQAELAEIAHRLARFRPTKVAVEGVSDAPDRSFAKYAAFTPADLATSKNETVQIGYRLAHLLGHERVYGIDEQSETIDYFPFDRVAEFAERSGRRSLVDEPMSAGRRYVEQIEARRRGGTIGDVLVWINDPAETVRMHRIGYYGMLPAGAGRDFPGAELNAMWFLRNAKIWAKLAEIAQPGDRVLVVYGAGHNYWLREFAAGTPGYRLVEANDYLAAP